jgi:hypothetical protein
VELCKKTHGKQYPNVDMSDMYDRGEVFEVVRKFNQQDHHGMSMWELDW